MQPGLQGFNRCTRGFGLQKQGPVQRLHQGAFSGFIRPTDQGDSRRKLQAQIAMEPHVLQLAVEKTHADQTVVKRNSSQRAVRARAACSESGSSSR